MTGNTSRAAALPGCCGTRMLSAVAVSLALAAATQAGLAAPGPSTLRFTDVTASTGFATVTTAWGVTTVDVDGDRDIDVLMANIGSGSMVYLNDGDFRFRPLPLPAASDKVEALVPNDFDEDGTLDLFVCAFGGPNTLLRGKGDGVFEDATERSGLPAPADGQCAGASFGDIDRDRHADLHVADFRRGDRLYLGQGGRFTDATETGVFPSVRWTESSLMADFDDDGVLDIYVARLQRKGSSLYLNDGTGAFGDMSAQQDVFGAGGQMGAAAFDADGDGDLDVVLVRGAFMDNDHNQLLLNEGAGTFVDATPGAWEEPARYRTAVAGDVDNDGDMDVFTASDKGCALWLNDGKGAFERGLASAPWNGLSAASAILCDLDTDGDLDLLVRADGKQGGGPADYAFRNELNSGDWLRVQPVDGAGSRFCHGAQVRVYRVGRHDDPDGLVARRDVVSACGWCTYQPFSVHVGLPAGTYDVEVRLADGSAGLATGVKTGQFIDFPCE